jgi:hypothetical protein
MNPTGRMTSAGQRPLFLVRHQTTLSAILMISSYSLSSFSSRAICSGGSCITRAVPSARALSMSTDQEAMISTDIFTIRIASFVVVMGDVALRSVEPPLPIRFLPTAHDEGNGAWDNPVDSVPLS